MRLSTVLIVLAQVASNVCGGGGGGKGSKHDILKIHVPEIIKHQHHTHYVFLHKYPHKKPKEKKKEHHHHHKHVHIPNVGYNHKHWYGVHTSHKSSHGHGHGHGHGHPAVVKTVVKHHKPHPPTTVHKTPKTHHIPKHHKTHGHSHQNKPKPKKAPPAHKSHPHHDSHNFAHEDAGYHPVSSSYEVTEAYNNPSYDPGQYHIPDEYGEIPVEGDQYGHEEDLGSKSFGGSFFSYPPTQSGAQYGQYDSGPSSYDISPYHQVESPKTSDFGDSPQLDDEYGSYSPHYENDFQFQHDGFSDVGHVGHQSDNFGENVPGYTQHHKHFLNEINHGLHKMTYDDTLSKVSTSQDEEGDSGSFQHGFDHGGRYGH